MARLSDPHNIDGRESKKISEVFTRSSYYKTTVSMPYTILKNYVLLVKSSSKLHDAETIMPLGLTPRSATSSYMKRAASAKRNGKCRLKLRLKKLKGARWRLLKLLKMLKSETYRAISNQEPVCEAIEFLRTCKQPLYKRHKLQVEIAFLTNLTYIFPRFVLL